MDVGMRIAIARTLLEQIMAMAGASAARAVYLDELKQPDEAGAALIKTTGLYPPGSLVRLSSGEMGLVVRKAGWSPPWTIANKARPCGSPKARWQRSAQRKESRIALSCSFRSAGNRTHSSSCIWISLSSRPWISIERSGDM